MTTHTHAHQSAAVIPPRRRRAPPLIQTYIYEFGENEEVDKYTPKIGYKTSTNSNSRNEARFLCKYTTRNHDRYPLKTTDSNRYEVCVCKSWLDLVESLEFAKSYVSKSGSLALDEGLPLTLAMYRGQSFLSETFLSETFSEPLEILHLVGSQDSGHLSNTVFKFKLPHGELRLHSSANGLLLMLIKYLPCPRNLFICNPITREYIQLPPPIEVSSMDEAFGFGVSKLTRKYKVVRMSHKILQHLHALSPCKCEVYTLGTGSWRSVAASGPFWYSDDSCVLLNGNLHWLVHALYLEDYDKRISYFDLETECYSTFSIPHHGHREFNGARSLSALCDSLCLCYSASDVVDIWLMNKYGDDKSWRKAYSIKGDLAKLLSKTVVPIKMFKNGDILLASIFFPKLYYYSSKTTKTILEVDLTDEPCERSGFKLSIYVPSFLPLKTFAMENVSSF